MLTGGSSPHAPVQQEGKAVLMPVIVSSSALLYPRPKGKNVAITRRRRGALLAHANGEMHSVHSQRPAGCAGAGKRRHRSGRQLP